MLYIISSLAFWQNEPKYLQTQPIPPIPGKSPWRLRAISPMFAPRSGMKWTAALGPDVELIFYSRPSQVPDTTHVSIHSCEKRCQFTICSTTESHK